MFVGVDTFDLLHPTIRSPSRASTFGGDSDIIFGDLLHPTIRSPSRASTFGGDSDIIFGV